MPGWLLAALKTKAAIAVIAVVSVGGVAAAATAVGDGSGPEAAADEPTTTTAPAADEPTTTTAPAAEDPTTTTTAPVVDAETDDDCTNHGQAVSAVARSTPPGPGHGEAVREAAHDRDGECGDDAVDDDATEADDDDDATEVDDDDDDATEVDDDSQEHGSGSGKGHGKD